MNIRYLFLLLLIVSLVTLAVMPFLGKSPRIRVEKRQHEHKTERQTTANLKRVDPTRQLLDSVDIQVSGVPVTESRDPHASSDDASHATTDKLSVTASPVLDSDRKTVDENELEVPLADVDSNPLDFTELPVSIPAPAIEIDSTSVGNKASDIAIQVEGEPEGDIHLERDGDIHRFLDTQSGPQLNFSRNSKPMEADTLEASVSPRHLSDIPNDGRTGGSPAQVIVTDELIPSTQVNIGTGDQRQSLPSKPSTRQEPPRLESKPQQPSDGRTSDGRTWVEPKSLVQQLTTLPDHLTVEDWSSHVLRVVRETIELDDYDAPNADELLSKLRTLATRAESLSSRLTDFDDRVAVRRVGHAIQRRIDLWQAIHEVSIRIADGDDDSGPMRLKDQIRQARANLEGSVHADSWDHFLSLTTLETALNQRPANLLEELADTATQTVGRLESQPLNDAQKQFLGQAHFGQFVDSLKALANRPIDLPRILRIVESYESEPNAKHEMQLADLWDQLRWRSGLLGARLGTVLGMHYRNANVRVQLSDELLNRLIPSPTTTREPVNDRIAGTRVRGQSEVRTEIAVELLPDLSSCRFLLQADGSVASKTALRKGILHLINQSRSVYTASKTVTIEADGLHLGKTRATVSSQPRLNRITSDLDLIPPIGFLIRYLARPSATRKQHETRHEVERKIARRVSRRIDQEVDARLNNATDKLQQCVITPLRRLDLNPAAIQLETTTESAIARWRVSSPRQIASFSPRPRPMPRSEANAQLHQSAVNNVLAQLELGGQIWTLKQLYQTVLDQLHIEGVAPQDDLPDDMAIKLDGHEAIRLSLEDGKATFTLQIRYLTRGNRIWRNLSVEADYIPRVDGLQAELVRDGGVRLTGDGIGIRDQFALRGIFTRFFSSSRGIPLLQPQSGHDHRLANLNVSQCEIRDGWIGLSISGPLPTIERTTVERTARRPRRSAGRGLSRRF